LTCIEQQVTREQALGEQEDFRLKAEFKFDLQHKLLYKTFPRRKFQKMPTDSGRLKMDKERTSFIDWLCAQQHVELEGSLTFR
jgi:hypothetical protein